MWFLTHSTSLLFECERSIETQFKGIKFEAKAKDNAPLPA